MNHLADFHVHPDYSIDATGTIRQYCDRALETGLRSICFTTHYDNNPRRVELDGYWHYNNLRVCLSDKLVHCYFDELEQARAFFADFGLRVYRGLEIDYFPGVESEIVRLRDKFPLDFVIGSVHCIDDFAISNKAEALAYFSKKSVEDLEIDYFKLLLMAASCRGFDSLGHLDYYVRYGREYYGDDIDNIDMNRLEFLWFVLKANNIGIEINTSQFKNGADRFHPTKEIIKMALQAGVKISSVGSDSHTPENLGLGLIEAYDFLCQLGIKPEFPKSI